MRAILYTATTSAIVLVFPLLVSAAEPARKPTALPFTPPYPERVDPFRQPINKEALVNRRDATIQQIDLKLKGFIDVGVRKAVVQLNGKIVALGAGETHHDTSVVELDEHSVTFQHGRHRWTETLKGEVPPPVPEATK